MRERRFPALADTFSGQLVIPFDGGTTQYSKDCIRNGFVALLLNFSELRFLCVFYAFFIWELRFLSELRFLCVFYLELRFLCVFYAFLMRFLCVFYLRLYKKDG